MSTRAEPVIRVRSIGLNTGYQVASQLAPAVAALLAIPFLLRHLGAELFGIVTILSAALAYFTMLDLGLGRAATRFIARSLETEHADDLRRYFWGSIFLLTGLGSTAAICACLAVPYVVNHLLKIPFAYIPAASKSLYIVSLTIPSVTLMATFRGFLESFGRFPYISIVTACSGVGLYLLPVLVINFGGGLVGVAVALAVARLGMCLAFGLGCLFVGERPSLAPVVDPHAVKRMLSFAGWLSVSNIVGTASLYGDRMLIGTVVGMAAVTSYGLPLDIISKFQVLTASFCAVLFPMMSRLDGSGSKHFDRVYEKAVAVVLALMTFVAVWASLGAPFVLKAWLGGRSTPESIFAAQVFLAGAVVQSAASVAWTALHARGRSDLTAWVHLAEFPIYIAVFYLAASRYGVRGAALAWFGRGIVDFLCMAVLLRSQRRDRKSGLPPELVAALVSLTALLPIVLPLREGALVGVLVCFATWGWTWRTLLDEPTRLRVATTLGRA